MLIDILTLFPEMFVGPFEWSIVKRAKEKQLVEIHIHDLRWWATDKHKTVDDKPYGGGAGMVMKVDIIDSAVTELKTKTQNSKDQKNTRVILMDAGGKKFNQGLAHDFSLDEHLIIICGHYEGVDHRVHEYIADEVVSVGDYVLSGGELPAMTVVDSVVRLIPGVVGNPKSLEEESHNEFGIMNNESWKEYPQYTRPEDYKGWKVPQVLTGGNHKKIQEWRKNVKN